MIEPLETFPDNVLGFVCHGHVTKKDYETVLIPRVERALAAHERIRLYYEIGSDFESIDPGAMWEDTKVGMSHLNRWERFAVVSDIEWIRHAVQIFGFLMPGEFRVFSASQAASAKAWIVS